MCLAQLLLRETRLLVQTQVWLSLNFFSLTHRQPVELTKDQCKHSLREQSHLSCEDNFIPNFQEIFSVCV